jgi:hypothetical protein
MLGGSAVDRRLLTVDWILLFPQFPYFCTP